MDNHMILKPNKTMKPKPAAIDQKKPTIIARIAGATQAIQEIFVVIQNVKPLFGLALPRVNKKIIKPMKTPNTK